jgi:hypothetical protein
MRQYIFCFCFALIPCGWCVLALNCGLVSTFQMDLGYLMRYPIGYCIDLSKSRYYFGTETWIDSSVKDAQILPGGFNIYRNDRNLNGGGVLLAVKDTLLTSAVPELVSTRPKLDRLFVKIKSSVFGHRVGWVTSCVRP